MALITDPPKDLPSTNALDSIPDDLLATPAAYLVFGSSPEAFENPPAVDDIRTYVVKTVCTGEHGPLKRKDGELRHTRTLQVIGCWESGKQPPDTDGNQTAMFNREGQLNPDATPAADAAEIPDLPEDTGVDDNGGDSEGDGPGSYGPGFSHAGTDD
jgi:hypothetical protein